MKIVLIQKILQGAIAVGLMVLITIYASFTVKGVSGFCYKIYHYSSPSTLSIFYRGDVSKIFDEKVRASIEGTFNDYRGKDFSLYHFCRDVQKNNPYIKSLTARLTPSRILQLSLTSVAPHFLVNSSLVLTDKKRLFEKELFSEKDLQDLGVVQCALADTNKIDPSTYDLLHTIPQEIYAQYIVSYSRPTYITLIPKNKEYCYRVIADATTLFDEKKRQALAKVADDVIKRNAHKKNNKQGSFVLDMRFKKGIIVKRSV